MRAEGTFEQYIQQSRKRTSVHDVLEEGQSEGFVVTTRAPATKRTLFALPCCAGPQFICRSSRSSAHGACRCAWEASSAAARLRASSVRVPRRQDGARTRGIRKGLSFGSRRHTLSGSLSRRQAKVRQSASVRVQPPRQGSKAARCPKRKRAKTFERERRVCAGGGGGSARGCKPATGGAATAAHVRQPCGAHAATHRP